MKPHDSMPLAHREFPQDQMLAKAQAFHQIMATRRTVRDFSDRPVPREIIRACVSAAGTAPSGANQQPWRFVMVGEPALKRELRIAAEAEEREFYERRASEAWKAALAPLGTDDQKPFLETAPWLIGVFYEAYGLLADGSKDKRYYPMDSVGIATGMLISALHHAGLATLTHTPSPMAFLNQLMGRPDNERPFLLLVVGYPADGCHVPAIGRKSLDEILTER
jgi:iodotyrosine deiodinase